VTQSAELEANTLLLSAHRFHAEHGRHLGMKMSDLMKLFVPNADSVKRDERDLFWYGGLLHVGGVTSITPGVCDAPTPSAAMLVGAAAPPVLPPAVSASHRGQHEAAAYMFYEEDCELKSDALTDDEIATAVAAIDAQYAKPASSDVVPSTSGAAVSAAASTDALEHLNDQVSDMLDSDAAALTQESDDTELNTEGVTSAINHVILDEQATVVSTDMKVAAVMSANDGDSDDDSSLPGLVDTSSSDAEEAK
jgi:hypothetical protein